MRSHGNSELSAPVRDAHLRQRVLNTRWPKQDKDGPHARGIQDKPAGEQIDVTVRLALERVGEVHLPGKAISWHGRCVLVSATTASGRVSCGSMHQTSAGAESRSAGVAPGAVRRFSVSVRPMKQPWRQWSRK